MAEKITRKVNIEYLASGLDNIIKSFEKLDPSTLSTKAQKSATEIVNIATTMRDQFKTAIAKGDISEEAAKQYEAMYNKFLGPDFSNKFRAILAGVGGDFDAAFNGMSERALQLNKDIANIESKITVEQKGFKTDGNNIDFATNTKRNEEAQKALKEVLKENQDIEEKSLTRAKEKLPTYENLQQAQERANAALAKMTPTQQKQLENFIKTGEVTDANRANVEKLVKTMEGNLSVQEVQARLRAKQLIDEKLSNTLNEKKNTLRDLENQKIEKNKELQKALDPVKMAEEEVRAQEKATNSKKTYNKNQAATVDILATVSNEIQNKKLRDEEQEKQLRTTTREVEKNVTAVKRQNNTLGKAANQVFNYGVAFGLLRRIYRETLRTIRDLDKALTEMAIVTTMSRKEAFKLADTMSNLARQTGFTTTEIAKLSTVFFRQGRALSEVIELTTVAAKSARIAGISAADSANFLTSAVNGFGLAADQVLAVSDRFAALAASSASSYQELAVGLSKFAAQANVAGVGIDFAMGMLAKGIETTREAPETIGTALKTVIARMRELTDLGKTLEDGMDVSRVETALRQVGIALRDEEGQFRDLEKVLTEIGMAWNTYDRNQQASIAVSLAGTRQQSRLIAIMQDFDRTLELVNISQESAGATNAQQVEYMKSLEAATVQLQTAWQDFIRTIGETETIIGIVRGLTYIIDLLTAAFESVGLSGRRATVIFVGLIVILKSWKVVVALASKITAAFTWAINTSSVATAANGKMVLFTAGTYLKLTAVMLPIVLIVYALIAGFRRLSTSAERSAANLRKITDEAAAANFEITRSEKNVNKLVESIQELEAMRYLTPQQEDELNTLREKLLNLLDPEVVENYRKGIITWNEVLNNISEEQGKNLAKRLAINEDLITGTISNIGQGVIIQDSMGTRALRQSAFTLLTDSGGFNEAQKNALAQGLTGVFTTVNKDVSEFSQKFLKDIIKNTEFSIEELNMMLNEPIEFVERYKPYLENLENFIDSVDFEAENFSDLVQNFKNSWDTFSYSLDTDALDFLRLEFPELVTLMEYIEEETLEDGSKQVVGLIADLERLNLTSTEDIQTAFSFFGEDIVNLTDNILAFADTLEGFSEDQRISYAFARASEETENLELRAWLLNKAFSETILEITQNLEKLQSRIKRVSDVQQEWLSGTLSPTNLLNFLESNSDLFQNLEDIEDFFTGANMSGKTFASVLEAQRGMVAQLQFQWERYHSSTDELEQAQALRQIAILGALTSYRGNLLSLTQEQHNYNSSLKAFNFLSSIGADTAEITTAIIQNQGAAMAAMANTAQTNLRAIESSFRTQANSIEGLSGNLFDYFTIVGDQLVPNMQAISELGEDADSALTLLTMVSEEFQNTMNEALDQFLDAREQSLKIEREALDAQKKIYEDYFAALDRLEEQRERKRSREDIVEQLARLEGATDERSRQKALELRRQLNQLDEETAQDTIEQARESLIQGLEDAYTEIENRWAQAAELFVAELANSGTSSGNAFVTAVKQAGLFSDVNLAGISFGTNASSSFIQRLTEKFGTAGFVGPPGPTVPGVRPQDPKDDILPTGRTTAQEIARDAAIQARFEVLQSRRQWGTRWAFRKTDRTQAEADIDATGEYAKGGIVDYTGIAMVHGSKSDPEAVLSPMQTEMFIGLRDALEKINFDSSDKGSINIENISISTASMNSNQDFNNAGQILAESFRNAIQRKGVTINTNKN